MVARSKLLSDNGVINTRSFPVGHLSEGADILVAITFVTEDVAVPLGGTFFAMLYRLCSLKDTLCSGVVLEVSTVQSCDFGSKSRNSSSGALLHC